VAEGQYVISENNKKALIYGENSLIDPNSTYKFDIRMK
jgi:hypothetical protein